MVGEAPAPSETLASSQLQSALASCSLAASPCSLAASQATLALTFLQKRQFEDARKAEGMSSAEVRAMESSMRRYRELEAKKLRRKSAALEKLQVIFNALNKKLEGASDMATLMEQHVQALERLACNVKASVADGLDAEADGEVGA